jgi:hypothetical protein
MALEILQIYITSKTCKTSEIFMSTATEVQLIQYVNVLYNFNNITEGTGNVDL